MPILATLNGVHPFIITTVILLTLCFAETLVCFGVSHLIENEILSALPGKESGSPVGKPVNQRRILTTWSLLHAVLHIEDMAPSLQAHFITWLEQQPLSISRPPLGLPRRGHAYLAEDVLTAMDSAPR